MLTSPSSSWTKANLSASNFYFQLQFIEFLKSSRSDRVQVTGKSPCQAKEGLKSSRADAESGARDGGLRRTKKRTVAEGYPVKLQKGAYQRMASGKEIQASSLQPRLLLVSFFDECSQHQLGHGLFALLHRLLTPPHHEEATGEPNQNSSRIRTAA